VFSQTIFEKVSYYILCELNHIFFNYICKVDRNFSKKMCAPHFYYKSIYFSYVKRHMTSSDGFHENCMTIDHTKNVTHWSYTTTNILNNYHSSAFCHFKFLPSFNSPCHKYSACSIRSLIAYIVLFKAFKQPAWWIVGEELNKNDASYKNERFWENK
jgi:hypothetical protein